MSEKKFSSLPENVQTALLEGGAKASQWEQEHYAELDKERLEQLREEGVEITVLDPAPFREAAKQVYDEFLTTEDEQRILRMIQETE
jgi:TRAP-type C4-dicarboxylate transport system substrate-binding protein